MFLRSYCNVIYVYTFQDDPIEDISPLMLSSCTASQLRSLANVDTNHILMCHHTETRLDGEVVSIFAYGLCTDETVHKPAFLTFTWGEKLSHKPIANDKYEYMYPIDLPIGWGLDGSILEYVLSWVQMAGHKGKGIEGQEYPHCYQMWHLRLI